jgi:hypothetical protein
MRFFPDLHSLRFKQMRFNAGFTPQIVVMAAPLCRTPAINHAGRGFIENKR